MNTSRQLQNGSSTTESVKARRDVFLRLNRRAMDLAISDDIAPAQSLAASASAMIADAVTRLAEVEPVRTTRPPETEETGMQLRLVGDWDEAA